MAKLRTGTLERLRQLEGLLDSRARRVRERWLAIVQVAVAAGLAYWVAQSLFHHVTPFFAPVTAIIILGLTGGDRIRRALELSFGVIVGVGLGDLLVTLLPDSGWTIPLIVAVALVVASFLSKSQLVSNQIAVGSILIATILPPGTEGGGPDRMIDAVIGAVIGLATIALLPSSPMSYGRQEISHLLGIVSSVLDDVAVALESLDVVALTEALDAIDDTRADISNMLEAAKVGREVTLLSPLWWGSRRRVRTLERIVPAVESTMRNARVLAHRALVLGRDQDAVPVRLINIVDELADVAASLADVFDVETESNEARDIPDLVRRLQVIGARSDMSVVGEDGEEAVLSVYVVLAQCRSLTVDLLEVCGWARESAAAALAPTSRTPAFPPEKWPGISDGSVDEVD